MKKLRWPRAWVGGPLRGVVILFFARHAFHTWWVNDNLGPVPVILLLFIATAFLLHPKNPGIVLGAVAGSLTVAAITSYYAQWLVFTMLAALSAVILCSGAFSAMLRFMNIAALKPALDLLPLANIRVLAAGDFGEVVHGPAIAGVILAVTVALFFSLAGWVGHRRPVR